MNRYKYYTATVLLRARFGETLVLREDTHSPFRDVDYFESKDGRWYFLCFKHEVCRKDYLSNVVATTEKEVNKFLMVSEMMR